MQLSFTIQDYVVLTITLVSTILGLFIGFSGALAFFCALGSAAAVAKLAWAFSADYLTADWSRALATLVITLLAFGLVRMIIRKLCMFFWRSLRMLFLVRSRHLFRGPA